MRKVVLDTDLFSECIKGRDAQVAAHYKEYIRTHGCLTITSWTVFGVLSGIHRRLPQRLLYYEGILREVEEIVPTSDDYRLAAHIHGALLRAGSPVGDIDPLIAACGIMRNLPVATGNTRHYQPVADLGFARELENWRLP